MAPHPPPITPLPAAPTPTHPAAHQAAPIHNPLIQLLTTPNRPQPTTASLPLHTLTLIVYHNIIMGEIIIIIIIIGGGGRIGGEIGTGRIGIMDRVEDMGVVTVGSMSRRLSRRLRFWVRLLLEERSCLMDLLIRTKFWF